MNNFCKSCCNCKHFVIFDKEGKGFCNKINKHTHCCVCLCETIDLFYFEEIQNIDENNFRIICKYCNNYCKYIYECDTHYHYVCNKCKSLNERKK